MPSSNPLRDRFLTRLDAVEQRLALLAQTPMPAGLTEPDAWTSERWDAGQVWAHLSEFLWFWVADGRMLVEARSIEQPQYFGRLKTTAVRVAAIEDLRYRPVAAKWARLKPQIVDLRDFLSGLTPDDWAVRGWRPERVLMTLEEMIEEFMVGHLEEHAAQLDLLIRQAAARR